MRRNVKKKLYAVFLGGLAGCVNGLFGGGGGMVVVPALTDLFGRERKCAQATAMLVILPISLISAFTYSVFGYFDIGSVVPTVAGTVAGGIVGAVFLKKTSDGVLFYLFYSVMFIAGLKMLF